MSSASIKVAKVDCHQHFWTLERGDYTWLNQDLAPIYRDFLPANLLPYLDKWNIQKTVVVQAAATVAESEYLLELAHNNAWISAVVGWVDFEANDVLQQLTALKQHPKFVGVRPMLQDIKNAAWVLNPEFSSTFEFLTEHNLRFDALITPSHLDVLIELAQKHPQLKIVIDHAAKPNIKQKQWHEWAEKMELLATQTNAFCKISGLLTEAQEAATLTDLEPYLNHLLEHFGSARLMWGSDWPVLNLASDYNAWLSIVEQWLKPLSAKQKNDIWSATATSFYGLD